MQAIQRPAERRRHATTLILAVLMLFMTLFMLACGRGRAAAPQRETQLVVDNRGYFDVVVYALPSPNASGRRLGNVSGGTSQTLRVRSADMQLGNQLVVRVRALAVSRNWVSPAITITDDVIARLDVQSTSAGDLSRSSLYPQLMRTER